MYEASDIVTLGAAHELILGQKPFLLNNMDTESVANREERQIDDIDEVDE